DPRMRAERELLLELAPAAFAHGRDRFGIGKAERVDEVAPHQVLLLEARELEDALAGGDDAGVLVAHDEARCLRRVVVVQQLEHEAEPTVVARGWLLREALAAVVVDTAVLAARAD